MGEAEALEEEDGIRSEGIRRAVKIVGPEEIVCLAAAGAIGWACLSRTAAAVMEEEATLEAALTSWSIRKLSPKPNLLLSSPVLPSSVDDEKEKSETRVFAELRCSKVFLPCR